jgi:hypothetical protein
LLGIPRRGAQTARSGKAGDSGNARQNQEPDHQKENENQEAFHSQIIRSLQYFWRNRTPHPAPSTDGLVKAPEAGHPLPQGEEGDSSFAFYFPRPNGERETSTHCSLFPIPCSLPRRLLHDGQDSSFNFLRHRAETIRVEQFDKRGGPDRRERVCRPGPIDRNAAGEYG